MREHEVVNSGCAKVRSLQYLQTWQMIVLILLNCIEFCKLYHQRFKRKPENLNYYPILRRKVSRALFVSVNSP